MMNDVFTDIIFPENPRNEIVVGMSAEDYRAAPGLSPSSIKMGVPDLEIGKVKGNAARLRAYLMGEIERKDSKSLNLGTLYHDMVLESSGVLLIDDGMRSEMKARRRVRKVSELVERYSAQKFMCNFTEAKAFKESTGRAPDESEQAALILARAERETDDDDLNSKSAEYKAMEAEANRIGAVLLNDEDPVHSTAHAMKRALDYDPANDEVREWLNGIDDRSRRVEVSIFCTVDIRFGAVVVPVQLKGRPDIIPTGSILPDFKTAMSLDIEDFSRESIRRGYFLSMGVYLQMLNLLAGRVAPEIAAYYDLGKKSRATFLCQETTPPYQTACYECPNNHLVAGWHFAKMAISDLVRRYLAEQNGERGSWKIYTDHTLNDPYYPAAISAFISEHASGGFGGKEDVAA